MPLIIGTIALKSRQHNLYFWILHKIFILDITYSLTDTMQSAELDPAERRLALVFGWEASKTILKVMEEGRMDEVFGSCAKFIKQVADGKLNQVNKAPSNLRWKI